MKNSNFGRIFGAALVACGLAGCANSNPNVSATDTASPVMQEFAAGGTIFTCQLSCAGTYGYNRQNLKVMYALQEWPQLAAKTLSIGYLQDQSYYYLGAAAEGMGYLPAARVYLNRALELADLKMMARSCAAGLGNQCDGLDIHELAAERLAQLTAASQIAAPDSEDLPAPTPLGPGNVPPGMQPIADAAGNPLPADAPSAPIYPPALINSLVQGTAVVECDFDDHGHTSNCKINSVTGSSLFGQSALEFLQTHTFRPATHNGVAVATTHAIIPFHFRLLASGPPVSAADTAPAPAEMPSLPPGVALGPQPIGDAAGNPLPAGRIYVPLYPDVLIDDDVQGSALVECDLDVQGHTSNCTIDSVTGSALFGSVSLQFVQNHTFPPDRRDGVAVASHKTWPFYFRLRNSGPVQIRPPG